MVCEASGCKTSTPYGIFIVTPSLEGLPTKAKEALFPYEVRLTPWIPNQYFNVSGKSLEIKIASFCELFQIRFYFKDVQHELSSWSLRTF